MMAKDSSRLSSLKIILKSQRIIQSFFSHLELLLFSEFVYQFRNCMTVGITQ